MVKIGTGYVRPRNRSFWNHLPVVPLTIRNRLCDEEADNDNRHIFVFNRGAAYSELGNVEHTIN